MPPEYPHAEFGAIHEICELPHAVDDDAGVALNLVNTGVNPVAGTGEVWPRSRRSRCSQYRGGVG
jgi:hypothetical protein